jgi:hypothetical protein
MGRSISGYSLSLNSTKFNPRTRQVRRRGRRVSIHEAGHAVANLVLGLQFCAAHVYDAPRQSASRESCLGEVVYDPEIPYPGVYVAIVALAGPIAEARATKTSLLAVLWSGGSHDMAAARAALEDSRFTYSYAEREARRLVNRHWPAIQAVALALVEHGRVGQGAVAMIHSGAAASAQ